MRSEEQAKCWTTKKPATVPFSRAIAPGLVLDARRAIWLEDTRTLAVADLHLGYAWVHRQRGNLLPLSAREDSLDGLLELVKFYKPHELALLGDIVHRAVPVAALKDELCNVITTLSEQTELTLIAGNHDRKLGSFLSACGLKAHLHMEKNVGAHLLIHGDCEDLDCANQQLDQTAARGGRVIIGHEHPAVTISDGVATSVKCPCFLVSERLIVLPAFSNWAAGSSVRSRRFMSAYAKAEPFQAAFAVMAGKILPVTL
jgi:putative SbcD/Mre11-related phosphoesterase